MSVDRRLEIEYLRAKYVVGGIDTDSIDWDLAVMYEQALKDGDADRNL